MTLSAIAISLRVHAPFCRTRRHHRDFYKGRENSKRQGLYLEALRRTLANTTEFQRANPTP